MQKLFILIGAVLIVSSCAYLGLPYDKISVRNVESVVITKDPGKPYKLCSQQDCQEIVNSPLICDNPVIEKVKDRVKNYIQENPDISFEIKSALENFTIQKGMNKDQVVLIIGNPSENKKLKNDEALWIYKEQQGELNGWFSGWAKLTFKNNKLEIIKYRVFEQVWEWDRVR